MSHYERMLDQLLDRIFLQFSDWSYPRIAAKSKLAISTIYNIDMRITRLPRLKTVYALARAASFDLKLVAHLKERVRG